MRQSYGDAAAGGWLSANMFVFATMIATTKLVSPFTVLVTLAFAGAPAGKRLVPIHELAHHDGVSFGCEHFGLVHSDLEIEPNLPANRAAGYRLVWHDEFDGKTLDPTKWKPYFPNQKRAEGYNDPSCAVLDGAGHLAISVKRVGDAFHSAMLDTEGLFSAKFGYFECRVRLQKQPGAWSAFWLESPHVSDPENGKGLVEDTARNGTEIDVMEYLPNRPYGYGTALHWNGYHNLHENVGRRAQFWTASSEGWHTFGVEWRPNGYTFYGDCKKSWETSAAISGTDEFIILSAEIGSWAGDIKTAKLPDAVVFDYVRVFQKLPAGTGGR